MNKLGDSLMNFINKIDYSGLEVRNLGNSLRYIIKFNSQEIDKILDFNFTNLFQAYLSSLSIQVTSEETTFFKAQVSNIQELDKFKLDILDLKDYNDINCEIIINKNSFIAGMKARYNELKEYEVQVFPDDETFINTLEISNLEEVDNKIFNRADRNILIIILRGEILLKNECVLIISNPDIEILKKYAHKNMPKNNYGKIDFRNQLCNWTFSTKHIVPDCTFFELKYDYNCPLKLEKLLTKISLYLIIPSISDFTSKKDNNIYSLFYGNKKIEMRYNEEIKYKFEDIKYVYLIYKWIYQEESNTDKFFIARNLITIWLCEICGQNYFDIFVLESQKIYTSILKNYDKYLISNVENYFAEKHKAKEIVLKKMEEMNNNISSIVESMNKNLFTLVGAFLVAAVTYSNKNNIYILQLTGLVYAIYMLLSSAYFLPFYRKRRKLLVNQHTKNMEIFNKELIEKDVPDDSSFKEIDKLCGIYWWGSCFIVLAISISIFVFIIKTDWVMSIVIDILKRIQM